MFLSRSDIRKSTTKLSRDTIVIPVALFLAIALAGCDDSVTDPNGNDDEPGPPAANVVEMTGNSFQPGNLEVTEGTTVTWVNESNEAHTVTSGSGGEHDGQFDSGNVAPGEQYQFTFENSGTYDYYCIPHLQAGMTGTITVISDDE